ncbi:hypothetical protein HanPI659440_Chr09g0329981 [Helianthus annuus]|nr:hypothetical protein HanPI659440_Chr09g0329981 [Helianthus annuus]
MIFYLFFENSAAMVYHSTANASISTVGSNTKEFVKKKWVNRTAKLK